MTGTVSQISFEIGPFTVNKRSRAYSPSAWSGCADSKNRYCFYRTVDLSLIGSGS